jgi:small subunit ribosomal protein S2
MTTKLLMARQDYLASGIHIGMKQRTAQMREFIYKIRPDGLAVMNLSKIDARIRSTAKFLARSKKILVVGRKSISHDPVKKFGESIGAKVITGRFMPGTMTNPRYKNFFEADAIIVTDPLTDHQALNEAVSARVPVIGICDTFNDTKNIDMVIPANNKGKKALATLFWLLAREIAKERGEIASDEEFKHKLDDFVGEPEDKSGAYYE